MNRLTHLRRNAALNLLVEGSSLASITRLTGVSKGALMRMIREIGLFCWAYHDQFARGLRCRHVEVDETWSFVGMKRRNVPEEKRGVFGNGDVWNWTALCSDSRFLVCWLLADHSSQSANEFMVAMKSRMAGTFRISADGLHSYPRAIDSAFGPYAMRPVDRTGSNTNKIERWNLTLRMGNRRFTRSTNGFSKCIRNHFFAMAIFAFHYNFVRQNRALQRRTPATAIGLTSRPLSFDDLLAAISVGGVSVEAARISCDDLLRVETAKILQWGSTSLQREYALVNSATAAVSA